jgi:hypothetical protein
MTPATFLPLVEDDLQARHVPFDRSELLAFVDAAWLLIAEDPDPARWAGEFLRDVGHGVPSAFPDESAEGRATAFLEVTAHDTEVRRYPLEQDETVIGRSLDCDVVVPSGCASRWHARVIRVGDRFYVEDMHTLSGTRVGKGPGPLEVIKGRILLQDGDEIGVGGSVVVRFRE